MYAIKDQNGRWFAGFRMRSISELEQKGGIPVFNPKPIPDFSSDMIMVQKLEDARRSMNDLSNYTALKCEIMELVPISVPSEK